MPCVEHDDKCCYEAYDRPPGNDDGSTFFLLFIALLFCGVSWIHSTTIITATVARNQFPTSEEVLLARLDPILLQFPRVSPSAEFANITRFYYGNFPPHDTDQASARHVAAYWVETNKAVSVIAPFTTNKGTMNQVSQHLPLWKTTHLSRHYGCHQAAINAGFFHKDGTSCGPLVIDNGSLVPSSNTSTEWVGIGFGKYVLQNDSDVFFALGNYHQWLARYPTHQLDYFVTGKEWLVYKGEAIPQTDTQVAPRTAVGLTRTGNWFALVVDGCEKCLRVSGMTLAVLSRVLVERGAQYSVNMDGGGRP